MFINPLKNQSSSYYESCLETIDNLFDVLNNKTLFLEEDLPKILKNVEILGDEDDKLQKLTDTLLAKLTNDEALVKKYNDMRHFELVRTRL